MTTRARRGDSVGVLIQRSFYQLLLSVAALHPLRDVDVAALHGPSYERSKFVANIDRVRAERLECAIW